MDTAVLDRIAQRLAIAQSRSVSRRATLASVVAIIAGVTDAAAGRKKKPGKKKPGKKRCRNGRVRFGGVCLLPCTDAIQCPNDPFTTWCWPTLDGRRRFCSDLGANLSDVCDLDYRRCSSPNDCGAGQVCLSTACGARCMDAV